MPVTQAAVVPTDDVLRTLGSDRRGLTEDEVQRRRADVGPNAVRSHHARPWAVLGRQLASPLLVLLLVTALVSFVVGEQTDAVIIGVILAASVGLGFVNEYRAERAAEALHSAVHHLVVVTREGAPRQVDVTELVPGDVVRLTLGVVVPADLRLMSVTGLECNESVLTGESAATTKRVDPVAEGTVLAELESCALMGTVVTAGSGTGVVVATGGHAEFGRIAVGLGHRQPETEFQLGLRRFSGLLVTIAVVLTSFILVTNLVLARPLLDSILFSLAIAVGITPQLLPAVVSTSLATGSRRMARRKVLVKRLVCIEDLGDVDVLVTDKTGTLTEGSISLQTALDPDGAPSEVVLGLGLLANQSEGISTNPLDAAIIAAGTAPAGHRRVAAAPFDHERRMSSVLDEGPDRSRMLIAIGAPESIFARCAATVTPIAQRTLDGLFGEGARVVAVATRTLADDAATLAVEDEHDLRLAGFLVFRDPPRVDAADALKRLAALGIRVKVATGDNARVAEKVCADLALPSGGTLTGAEIDGMDDERLAAAVADATIFARISPEQKARIVALLRHSGRAVGFLGDGVNDALALHAADVGISVETATDIAKDAADVLLLEKNLDVLADGVAEGRRTFANTIKYVLMGTSSNFGNMFSAAAASAVLPFLPMLPSQILLNNLLYDAGQLTIPTDHVDPEQVQAPARWDLHLIRHYMFVFGPLSSLFDFLTFAIMIGVLHAGPELFRSGWFVESLATQSLVIFAIRTRRVPFLRSRPSLALVLATVAVVAVGIALPYSPLAGVLGFQPLPVAFLAVVIGLILVYLLLVEAAKRLFFATATEREPRRRRAAAHRVHRRAGRFSHPGPLRRT